MKILMNILAYTMVLCAICAAVSSGARAEGQVAGDVHTFEQTAAGQVPVNGQTAASVVFSDVNAGDWYYQHIDELAKRGFARGNPDGTYAPEAPLLVDEFLAFTLRTLGHDVQNSTGYWAQSVIERAIILKLIDADAYEKYDAPITREQIADIVVRASGEEFGDYIKYSDVFKDIDDAAKPESILKAIELGVLAGYQDHTFRPAATATRAEAAVMVLRMIDKSYRLELFGNVFINRKTDMNENGAIQREKAQEILLDILMNDFHVDASPDGKAVVSLCFPDMPDGYEIHCMYYIFDRNGKILAYNNTNVGKFIEQLIPQPGYYEIYTDADIDKIGSMSMYMSVSNENETINEDKSKAIIYVFKYFYERDDNIEILRITTSEDAYRGYLDFDLVRGIWRW